MRLTFTLFIVPHKKVTEGFIYLLEEGILFLVKTTWISIDDVARIEMVGGSSRDFELHVELHSTGKVSGYTNP